LTDVIRRFPDSEYARDARLKLDLTYDHLAGKEMYVGRFYLRQNKHIAAINRFKTVVYKYQTTNHVPEALHRLTEAYLELGVVNEARSAAAVLGHNYPGTKWYEDSYKLFKQRGLLFADADDQVMSGQSPQNKVDNDGSNIDGGAPLKPADVGPPVFDDPAG